MSGKIVGMVLRARLEIEPAEKLVLVVHAEYTRANSGGVSWPSVSTIAAEAGLTQRRVKAIRKKLVADGYLTIVQQSRGGPSTTKYRLNLLRLAQAANSVADSTVKGRRTVSPTTPSEQRSAAGNGAVASSNSVVASKNGAAHDTVTVLPTTPEPELSRYITGSEPVTRAREANALDTQASSQDPFKKILKIEAPPASEMTPEQREVEKQRQLRLAEQYQQTHPARIVKNG